MHRLDEALSRRGFTTRWLRVRAAAVLVAITAGVSGTLLYNLTNVLGPDTVCGGSVSADAVHAALGSGRVSEDSYQENLATVYNRGDWCDVTVSSGVFGGSHRSASLSVRLDNDHAIAVADANDRLFAGAANGGSTGGANSSSAWALLPEGCSKGLRVEVSTAHKGPNDDGAPGLARLAVNAANGAAAKNHCGQGTLPAPKNLSAAGVWQPADATALCGLSGLTVPKGEAALRGYEQQVTTVFDPVWSCKIGGGKDRGSVLSFAIATDSRASGRSPDNARGTAYGRARWTGYDEVVADCQGKPVYFQIDLQNLPLVERFFFPDRADLWKQFLTAGGKAIGCEPIIP
ncbi:hypothetical protein [Kitasatospora sp. NPDC092286]|uniref:hypothetical protein n=1 Tax=Kitasatospora sp. NPDC092286 TaxID=3364087 RepID=UPI0038165A1B